MWQYHFVWGGGGSHSPCGLRWFVATSNSVILPHSTPDSGSFAIRLSSTSFASFTCEFVDAFILSIFAVHNMSGLLFGQACTFLSYLYSDSPISSCRFLFRLLTPIKHLISLNVWRFQRYSLILPLTHVTKWSITPLCGNSVHLMIIYQCFWHFLSLPAVISGIP